MSNKKTLVGLTDTMRSELIQIQKEDGNTLSEVIRHALRDYIDARKTKRMMHQAHNLHVLTTRNQIIGRQADADGLQAVSCGN